MSSDISLTSTSHQVENRAWMLSQFGQGPGENPNIVLDFSLFTQATHFPNGFVKSGEPLAKVTATGFYGPYTPGATNGLEVGAGLLHSVAKKPGSGNRTGGALVVAGFIKESKLPRAIDNAFRTALRLCHFTA